MDEKEVVCAQLTLRVMIWDVFEICNEEWARLDRELLAYQIKKLDLGERGEGENSQDVYGRMCRLISEGGVLENETLLVTEDAELAAYMYKMESNGIAVVYYERDRDGKMVLADMVVQGFEEVGVQFLDRVQKRRNRLPWNILYTERTCVREISLSDLDELYELYEGKGITDYTEPLYERQKEEEYTRSYIDYMYYYYGYGMWIVRDRVNGKLIGRAGIEHREEEDSVLMELGYIIGTEYQNQGYASEVCQAIIQYARQMLEIRELHCFIHPKNEVSIHVAKKLGFWLCSDSLRYEVTMNLMHFCRKE